MGRVGYPEPARAHVAALAVERNGGDRRTEKAFYFAQTLIMTSLAVRGLVSLSAMPVVTR